MTFYRNGTLLQGDTVSEFAREGWALRPSMCGSGWSFLFSPGITTEDTVEIHLHDPHSHGNASAYRDFLNTLYNSPNTPYILEAYLRPYSMPFQIAGALFIIVALMLLGAALASGVLRILMDGAIGKYGLLALFMGGFVILDSVGISFLSELVVFNTYGRQLCMMLAVYCMGMCTRDVLTGKRRKAVGAAMLLSALVDCVLVAVSFTGVTVIYDTGVYWAVVQVLLCPLLMACSILELCRGAAENRRMLLAGVLLSGAVLLDIAGVGRSIYSSGSCTKAVFALLFVCAVARAVKRIIIDHQASMRTERLERELEGSKAALALSQIQPHFIYNTLGTIEQLCREEPDTACRLVRNFSLYLRGNLSEMDNPAPISLSREIEHTRHYAEIEHIRFPDMEIRFALQTDDFMLPALSVQPLVENAIKHGISGLETGGTVTVSAYETEKAYCVCVADDGVGFDTSLPQNERKHVGIRNIRRRVEVMCGGTLTIESTPGKGTAATITIPRERGEEHGRHHSG